MNYTDFDFIIIGRGENNGYHDSDFYVIAYDVKNDNVIKHVHSSTRGYGYIEIGGTEQSMRRLPEAEQAKVKAKVCDWITRDVLSDVNSIYVGDIAENTNPRARKHKGAVLEVVTFKDITDIYGRRVGVYAIGVELATEAKIRINTNNLELRTRNLTDDMIERLYSRLTSDTDNYKWMLSI